MEWRIKLEAKSGWGEVETIEIFHFKRRVVGLTAEEISLSLEESKRILAELQRIVLQTQMEEYTFCARVCPVCLRMRRQRDCRTRTIQTLFGTVTVEAPRISICPCSNRGFVDMSSRRLPTCSPTAARPSSERFRLNWALGTHSGKPGGCCRLSCHARPPTTRRCAIGPTGSPPDRGLTDQEFSTPAHAVRRSADCSCVR